MSAEPTKGRFIVVEGIDGAGTTTQAEALGNALREFGLTVVVTRQPSAGPVGLLIRQALSQTLQRASGTGSFSPEALALLFAADRVDHLNEEILPALARGEVVVCDRYLLSSLAYQGSENPVEWVEEINRLAIEPDLTLFLEVGVDVASARRAQRGGGPEMYEVDEKQRRIAEEYLAAIRRRSGKERIVRLDGSLPPGEVTRLALGAIRKTLSL